jgi:hypothetical protein
MNRDLTTEEINRLTALAESLYPIDSSMCAGCRVSQNNKRMVFVWKMKKVLAPLSENGLKTLLNALEGKASPQPTVPQADKPVGQ